MSNYVAQSFVAGSPQAEVSGMAMIAFAENLESKIIQPILEKYGLKAIDSQKWYPHQLWMDILKEMNDTLKGGATTAFVAFGRQVVQTAVMPPEIQSIPDVLHALHAIHHANLRNIPEEEGYFIEVLGDCHYLVHHNTPNPEDAIYGFLWGLVARFKAKDEVFVVRRIESKYATRARSTYEIKWGKTKESIS